MSESAYVNFEDQKEETGVLGLSLYVGELMVSRTPDKASIVIRGVALAPQSKDLMVAGSRLNAVLTFYFPEMF